MKRKGRKAKVLTDERIDILMLLSDDLGYPAWFIAEQLGKKPSNLSPIIKTLEKPFKVFGWDCVIDPQDISNPRSLISKILSGKDEICEDSYLLGLQIGVFKVPTSVALMPANLH